MRSHRNETDEPEELTNLRGDVFNNLNKQIGTVSYR